MASRQDFQDLLNSNYQVNHVWHSGQTLHYQLTSVRIGNALASKRVFEIWGNLKKRGQLQKLTLLEFPTPRCDFRGYVAEERWSPDRL